jgi:SAM-dependent methyltransferase
MLDWEQRYRVGDTPWDKGRAAPPLEKALSHIPAAGRALVPGCGTGHEVRLAARFGWKAVGIDLSPTAINRAQQQPAVAGESYLAADFLNLPATLHHHFALVLEHTCFCALDPRQRKTYFEAASQALETGGLLLGVFFTQVSDVEPNHPPLPCPLPELLELSRPWFDPIDQSPVTQGFSDRQEDEEWVCLWRKRI